MRFLNYFLVVTLAAAALMAQSASSERPQQIPSFDASAIDKSANACEDFYQYACGNWMKNNPIPADQATWGRFSQLNDNNLFILRDILEKASTQKSGRSQVDQEIGDMYGSCMDEGTVNKLGATPLKASFDRIDAMKSKDDILSTLIDLHSKGVNSFFNFGPDQDFQDATQVIAEVDQGGLALPDRDYYLRSDEKSTKTREQYVVHVTNMFKLLGDSPEKAAAEAKVVMDIETELAKGSMDHVSRREPKNLYHKMDVKALSTFLPSFSWDKYFQGVGVPQTVSSLNVVAPDYLKAMNGVLAGHSLDDLKIYLRWHVLHGHAPLLAKPFVDENFSFYGTVLTGQKQIRPRWKRCVSFVDNNLGEALGQAFVAQTFGAEGKERTLKMVKALESALGQDIKDVPWMSDTTKKEALKKLDAIANKIGYPDVWRDYSSVKIAANDLIGNSERASAFEVKRQLNKIGKPVDKKEWGMTPPTVNAYYDPQLNNINFPAGILQPPFYSNKADDAVNFGGIGMVIGHELTHGFDDEGRQFDPGGNLRDWWTEADGKEFEKRAQCIVDEYSSFDALPGLKGNGKLTEGENVADNGGIRIALMALASTMKQGKDTKGGDAVAGLDDSAQKIDGYTPLQRFFISYGQIWCQNIRDEAARQLTLTNEHSLGKWRVNGVVQNVPEFSSAFGCKAGDKMVRQPACRVW
jgi:putative endopeptidase